MTSILRGHILAALMIAVAVMAMTGCAKSSRIDGGIVGTGDRIECDTQATKDGGSGSMPANCTRDRRP